MKLGILCKNLTYRIGSLLLLLLITSCAGLKKHSEIMELGRIHYKVAQYTEKLPEINKIEINVLQDAALEPWEAGNRDDYSQRPGPKLFPVYPYGRYDKILSTIVISGADAVESTELWKGLHFSKDFGALCHYPAYGLRFFHENQLFFETSVCWQCSNFTIPEVGFWGFDSRSRSATNLLNQLGKFAPLPPKAPKEN